MLPTRPNDRPRVRHATPMPGAERIPALKTRATVPSRREPRLGERERRYARDHLHGGPAAGRHPEGRPDRDRPMEQAVRRGPLDPGDGELAASIEHGRESDDGAVADPSKRADRRP